MVYLGQKASQDHAEYYFRDSETNEKHTVYQGEAFTIKCNLSDLHPNVVISTDFRGEHNFSPAMDGSGKLIANDVIYDITDYTINEK